LLKNGIDEREAQQYIIKKEELQNFINKVKTENKAGDSIDSHHSPEEEQRRVRDFSVKTR
jgi:hypothetical protein